MAKCVQKGLGEIPATASASYSRTVSEWAEREESRGRFVVLRLAAKESAGGENLQMPAAAA
jgi:hypothetical protein